MANYTGSTTPFNLGSLTGRHVIGMNVSQNQGTVLADGVVKFNNTSFSGSYISNVSQAVFATKYGDNDFRDITSAKVYYLKMWQNNVLVRDFIPVRVGNIGYLYDRVTKRLFGNIGTGSFILGSDKVENDYVDLGLPSGLLWANGNIIKDIVGNCSIGKPTDYGCYFSWGNIEGHNNGEGYDFGTIISGPYASTPGAQVSADIASNDSAHDAALACLGAPWHMPTKEDFKELYDNTDRESTTIDEIKGYKFMKKTDHSVYVFFPDAGLSSGTSVKQVGTAAYNWSSSWYSSNMAYCLYNTNSQYRTIRCYGYPVRAVRSSN